MHAVYLIHIFQVFISAGEVLLRRRLTWNVQCRLSAAAAGNRVLGSMIMEPKRVSLGSLLCGGSLLGRSCEAEISSNSDG